METKQRKKWRLKKGVKNALLFLGVVGVIVLLVVADNISTKRAIDQCVSSGHEISYCENGLK